jgi:hypothetical protein
VYYTAKSVAFGTFVPYVNEATKLDWKRVQTAYGISDNVTLTNTMVPSSHIGKDMSHSAHICYSALFVQIPLHNSATESFIPNLSLFIKHPKFDVIHAKKMSVVK